MWAAVIILTILLLIVMAVRWAGKQIEEGYKQT